MFVLSMSRSPQLEMDPFNSILLALFINARTLLRVESVAPAQVSNWDVSEKKWTVTSGKYGVSVGSSSQDIRLTGSLTVA